MQIQILLERNHCHTVYSLIKGLAAVTQRSAKQCDTLGDFKVFAPAVTDQP